jgi:hypothetical protein
MIILSSVSVRGQLFQEQNKMLKDSIANFSVVFSEVCFVLCDKALGY